MAYTTDLTLAQFEVLAELLPQSKTKKGFITKHLMVNAILYQLKNGCQWRDLPDNFPNWQTVYSQFRRWRLDGTWEEVLTTLAKMERTKQKKTNIQVYS
jgi:transposase